MQPSQDREPKMGFYSNSKCSAGEWELWRIFHSLIEEFLDCLSIFIVANICYERGRLQIEFASLYTSGNREFFTQIKPHYDAKQVPLCVIFSPSQFEIEQAKAIKDSHQNVVLAHESPASHGPNLA
jgi:hypothetical protein